MAIRLVCLSPTMGFNRGDLISDPEKVKQCLGSDVEHHFVKSVVPDEPEATPEATPEAAPEAAPEAPAAAAPEAADEHPPG